jgi:alkylhydroperoxidase/carboxymuconolactone decarboxylase family protein
MSEYYESGDLAAFKPSAERAPVPGKAFFDYYGAATAPGRLDAATKALIGLAVAHSERCPYCIDSFTNACLSLGLSDEEMLEAAHVAAAVKAGAVLVHSTQAMKIVDRKEMG